MESKFTKGEWQVRDDIVEETYEVVSNIDDQGYYDMICESLDELANAHLIAAAPEMYAMLDGIDFDDGMIAEALGEDFQDSLISLLAKARGEL